MAEQRGLTAESKSSVAVLRRRRRTVLLGLAFLVGTPAIAAWTVVQPMPRARAKPLASHASPERLKQDVRRIVGEFGPRGHEDLEGLDHVADHLADELERAGARVSRQRYPEEDGGDGRFQNVIARFGPDDGPVVVVGAHYDAADGLPGADDNASGTAGLLELGRLLGEGSPLPTTVELVAYSTEEPPHFRTAMMGSAVHAQTIEASETDVRVMICLEMIGRFEDEVGTQSFPAPGLGWLYSTRGDFVALVGRWGEGRLVRKSKRAFMGATSVPVRSMNAPPGLPGIDFSDHLNYWARDIPAVMVTDTAFFRNADYHTEYDTPDRLDYERMAQAVDGVHGMVLAFAEG